MDKLINDFFDHSTAFISLDEDAKNLIWSKFSSIELNTADILFNQGDPADSLYVLMKGKLSALLTTTAGKSRVVGYIQPGEIVGEIGVLANEPRTLTVKALTDSVLLKLTTDDFTFICQKYPNVMLAIIRPLLTRTSSLIQLLSTGKRNKHIVILPANHSTSLQSFSTLIESYAKEYPSILMVSDYQQDFHSKEMTVNIIQENISRLTQAASPKIILYLLSATDTPLAKYALKRADIIYVTAYANTTPTIDHHVIDKINYRKTHLASDPHLILLYEDKQATPNNTINWLKLANFNLQHHVRLSFKNDVLRLFRFFRGKAVGVVLSGGGTRGWAHIGAIKALKESKIPIDIIGGTSVGALVAGCYASNQSSHATEEMFKHIIIRSARTITWRSLTLPIISLFNAKNYTQAQQQAFGNQQIEDLWIPYFCVSSNLATNSESIHQTGTLWEKVRASTAIPGLVPPMLINDELHIDGGLINNFPVDVMRRFVGHHGRIIAVELNSFSPDKTKYHFPPILTLWDSLLIKLGFKQSSYRFPRLIDTFMRSLSIGSDLRSKQNALLANTCVSLVLDNFNILHSNPEEGPQLIQIGYEETLKQLGSGKK